MTYKLLIVDDEPANLRLLERLFRRNYEIITATSGAEGLELLRQHAAAVIISDQRMPGMTGVEFLKLAAEMRQHTLRIILTGYTDASALVEAINSGVVYKYVTKPWNNDDLQQTVALALQHYETNRARHDLTLQTERLTERLRETTRGFVRLIADALDAKDEHAHGHARRTSGYATAIARRLNFDSEDIEQLSLAAFLHDIGRIGTPDSILMKSGALTDEERAIVQLHSERGARMLAGVPDFIEASAAVRHHHEHFDGTGYPEGLSGNQIPLHARIIGVADAYDAMTNPRPFRHALTHEEAVAELQSGAGVRFDPDIVAAFCSFETIGRIRRYISEGSSLESERMFGDETDIPPQALLEIIETDLILALEVLRAANALQPDAPTARLLTAGARIGEARLRALVEIHGLPAPDQESEWRTHSLRCAVAAYQLAEHTGVMHPEDAYTLGLLHNAGDLLLHTVFPMEMFELTEMEEDARLARQVEMFGVEAAQISQWMLEACGVPRPLTAAVQTHHDVMRINAPTALLLHVANRIANAEEAYQVAAVDALGTDRLAMLGVSRADLHSICERTAALADERILTAQQVAVG